MSLKSLVKKSVDLAFNKAGDLATNVVFNKKTVTEYDFTDQSVDIADVGTVIVKGLQLSKLKQRPGQSTNSTALRFLFKTVDIGNISEYSNAVINNVTYKFDLTSDINDYVTVLAFVREN